MTDTTPRRRVTATPTEKAARKEVLEWMAQAKLAIPERDDVITGLLVCAIARSNLIMYGKPGTAKSLVATAFAEAVDGKSFQHLMTRYTTPNELFGPVDVQALKAGSMKRVTEGYIPTASVAFLDEGFKANSACLNSLLSAVNEHIFHDDGKPHPIPLRVAVLASNEFPEDSDNLQAFDDRFPMRFDVVGLKNPENFAKMVTGKLPKITAKIREDSVEALGDAAKKIEVTLEVVEALRSIQTMLTDKGIYASDRKMHTCTRLLQAQAALTGERKVTTTSLALLENILWLRPQDKEAVKEIIRGHVAKWLRDLRSAIEVVDAGEAEMNKVIKAKTNIQDMASGIAKAAQKIKDLNSEILPELAEHEDAYGDVQSLKKRINGILKIGQDAIAGMF